MAPQFDWNKFDITAYSVHTCIDKHFIPFITIDHFNSLWAGYTRSNFHAIIACNLCGNVHYSFLHTNSFWLWLYKRKYDSRMHTFSLYKFVLFPVKHAL